MVTNYHEHGESLLTISFWISCSNHIPTRIPISTLPSKAPDLCFPRRKDGSSSCRNRLPRFINIHLLILLFMPFPALPCPPILQLCMLIDPLHPQVLSLREVPFQLSAAAQNPRPGISVQCRIAKMEEDLDVLNVREVIAGIVDCGN